MLSLAHLNVQSLLSKFGNFKAMVQKSKYDIVALGETWLTSSIDSSKLNISNYVLVRKDRGSRAGGVAFYTNSKIRFEVIDSSDIIEQLWISCILEGVSIATGVIYRQPSYSYSIFINELESTLIEIIPYYDKIILVGDINIDMLSNSYASSTFNNMLQSMGFSQIIDSPTRITSCTATLIDVVCASDLDIVHSSGVLSVHGLSDHELVYCNLKFSSPRLYPQYKIMRSFKRFNYDLFLEDLYQIPFFLIFDSSDVDEQINFLTSNLLDLINAYAPLQRFRFTKPPAPWFTDTIAEMQKLRNDSYKKFKLARTPESWDYYKQLRNITNRAIDREKKAFVEYRMRNTKDMWGTLKTLGVMCTKRTAIPENLRKPHEINTYFISSISLLPLDNDLYNFYYSNHIGNSRFTFSLATDMDVLQAINSIKSNASDIDGLNIRLIKLACPHIVPYLRYILNTCITTGTFPLAWKRALIRPLPKTSNPSTFADLRPISMLPILSKVAEKILYKQLQKYVYGNKIIPDTQSGFRSGFSCTTALMTVIDDIIAELDKGRCTVLCLLDFSKAFDTINHDLLTSILHFVGLDDNSIRLLSSYVTNRVQVVGIDDMLSDFLQLQSGIPQGSVIGPLMYTIYTCYFQNFIKFCRSHFYADDTQLYYSFAPVDIHQACRNVNVDLQTIVNVAKRHSLVINPNKSEMMLFAPAHLRDGLLPNIHIHVDNVELTCKDTIKSLGLLIDSKLRFNDHINKCTQKAYCNLKLIYSNRSFLTRRIKSILCESLVLSHFNYGDAIYSPLINTIAVRKIQKIQNSCLRLIFGIRRYEHVTHKLNELQWLNMKNRRILHAACLYFTIIGSGKPPYLYNKITFRSDVHTLNIRFKGTLTPPAHKRQLFKKSFSYQITSVYNNIPRTIRSCRSLLTFKRNYFDYLLRSQL